MQEYRNDEIVVRYDPKICIHAGFRRSSTLQKNPWIDVGGAPAREIAEQVKRCPSGALSFELLKKAE